MTSGGPRLTGLLRSEDGAAVAEFVMVLPIFLVLVSGLYDGARLINESLQVHAAAQAGAAYVRKNGWDAAGVTQAVTAATPLAVSADPAPSLSLGCVRGEAIVSPNADGSCPGGGAAGGFVYVSAQAPFTPKAPWPQAVWPAMVTARNVVRVQ